jgi:PilZ domain
MDAGISPARQTRTQYRHELHTLTYVTLDQANGGIVRNLSGEGMGVQAVAAPRPQQQLRLRFELRRPRLRIETRGEVMWTTSSGQCGIRFVDLPSGMIRQINEWVFGDLLEGASVHLEKIGPVFIEPEVRPRRESREDALVSGALQDDGLLISPAPLKIIELPARQDPVMVLMDEAARAVGEQASVWDWLSQPISGRGLAWAVNTLVVVAACLLFTLVFLSVTHEAPPWPLLMIVVGACAVGGMYWAFFRIFGGSSLGARLARLAASDEENDEEERDARFR